MATDSRKTWMILLAVMLLHAAFTLMFALVRLYSYKTSLLDDGVFEQIFWGILHRGAPLSTPNPPYEAQHWFGFHFSPILLLIAPFYALWPRPEMLHLVQSLAIAATVIPLFFAALKLTEKRYVAWVCVALYVANPFVLSAALWDFHEIALACPMIALCFWALVEKRLLAMSLGLILLALTKEHYGVAICGFGALWGWRYGEWKKAAIIIAAGVAVLYAVLFVIMPYFHGGQHSMLASGSTLSRFGWIAAPWEEKAAIFRKLFIGGDIPQVTGLLHLLLLLVSGLMFALAAPFYLAPAAADLAANILSANPMPRHVAAYHAAPCIAVFLLAAAQGYSTLCTWRPHLKKLLAVAALCMASVFPATGLTVFPLRIWELDFPVLRDDKTAIANIKAILDDEPVSVQANIGVFFAERAAIYPFPEKRDAVKKVVLHLVQPFSDPATEHFNIPFGMPTREYVKQLRLQVDDADWSVLYWDGAWLVMERKPAKADAAQHAQIIKAIEAMSRSRLKFPME